MVIILLIGICFIFYTSLGYPLILYLWSVYLPQKINKNNKYQPNVSIIIVAKNEERNIERRIMNLISQGYPKKRLEIIVVSDGSSDNTNVIVKKISKDLNKKLIGCDNFLRLISFYPSRGKPYAINLGVKNAKGNIIVFADSRQLFSKDAINHLVNNFNDETVGCVSGELVFKATPWSSIENEMNTYWNFEKYVRKLESKTGSVIGATGAIYAIRKCLFRYLPEQTLLDDVLIPLNICMQGYKVIFESNAIAYDHVSKDIIQERKRKIRTLAGNWQLMFLQINLINPIQNPLWFKFISHKIFRLLIPYWLIIIFGIIFYLRSSFSLIILILSALFTIIALLKPFSFFPGMLSSLSRLNRTIILLNYFALLAPFRLLFSREKLW